MTTVKDWERKYYNLYCNHKQQIIRHEEQKMALFDQIEKLQLQVWRDEITDNEIYLVDKIERLEEELKTCEELRKSQTGDNSESVA